MAHWQDRPEPRWKDFRFNQPYAKGLKRLKEEVLGKTNFDPATLWQWGTMQAMAVIEILGAAERELGAEGQRLVREALVRVGRDVGRQLFEGVTLPDDLTEEEFISFFATIVNRIVYASLEAPRIDGEGKVSFDILWCPHQDHYQAFDCRVQRYLVQGMLEGVAEVTERAGWTVRFDSTIPAGAPTCHFTLWKASDEERDRWRRDTELIEARALRRSLRSDR